MGEAVSFGTLLRQYRLSAALSQEALAERARLSASAIAALERGRRTVPRPDTVSFLAEALGLTPIERGSLIGAAIAARAPGADKAPSAEPAVLVHPASAAPAPLYRFPVPPTSLIGREYETAAITHLLRREGGARLHTLTGPGGVGKTRLALAVAAVVRDAFPDGVVFIDLAPLRDATLVASSIAQALDLRDTGALGPRQVLQAYLQDRRMLLVLDNLEQVVAAAPLVAQMVAACPQLAILATSRVALHVRAEQRFQVRPLDTPDDRPAAREHAGRTAAVRLFVARAQAVAPDFALDAGNEAAVAEICRRLDGLPLALELAAARISLLPPAALLARLERRLPVLGAGTRDLPPRQQTLRATIEWSYALLSEREQVLFRRLSVFAGGCTLEAAEAVAAFEGIAGGDIVAALETLVEHSLLQTVPQADSEPRFRMLETIREYGLVQLATAGEEATTRQRHATYCLSLAEAATSRIFESSQMRWLGLLELEHDNLREALSWACEHGGVDLGLRLAGLLWRFWYIHCHLSEGRDRLRDVLALPGAATVAPPIRLHALVGLAVISYAQTDYDQAERAARESAALARTGEDRPNLIVSLNILGGVSRHRSEYGRAAALGEECEELSRAMGDPWSLALTLSNMAEVACIQGAFERAVELCDESLTISRSLGDRWGVAQALLIGGRVARDRGAVAEAAAQFEEGLAIVRELGHTRDIANALAGLGQVAQSCGECAVAVARYEESLTLLRPLGDRLRVADVVNHLARTRHAQGDTPRAAGLYGEGLIIFRSVGNRLGIAESLEGLAAVAGPTRRAARLLAAASALRAAIGAPIAPADRPGYDRLVAEVCGVLGDRDFAAAWAAGTAFSEDQALAEALAIE